MIELATFSPCQTRLNSCDVLSSGEIINIELVTFRRQFEESVSRDLDPNQTASMVDLDKVSRNTKVIRLYYVKGQSSGDIVGMETYTGYFLNGTLRRAVEKGNKNRWNARLIESFSISRGDPLLPPLKNGSYTFLCFISSVKS